jgi:hypothetical protein
MITGYKNHRLGDFSKLLQDGAGPEVAILPQRSNVTGEYQNISTTLDGLHELVEPRRAIVVHMNI